MGDIAILAHLLKNILTYWLFYFAGLRTILLDLNFYKLNYTHVEIKNFLPPGRVKAIIDI